MALETRLICFIAFVAFFIVSLQAQTYISPAIVPVNNRYGGSPLGSNPYDCFPGVYGGASGGGYPPMGLSYGGNGYPGSNFGTLGGYGPTTAKPSYAYFTGYGNTNALSNYEGPIGGHNTYWQPGVSYPPQGYGAYGSNYGQIYGSTYNQGQQGFGGKSCKDRSSECAMLASSGQCANSLSTRNLCPLSCGTGCVGADSGQYSGPAYGSGLAGSVYSTYPYSPLNGNNPIGFDGYSGNSYGQTNGYQPSLSTLSPTSYGLLSTSSYGLQFPDPQGGYFPICKDSHIQGCQNWAGLGYCVTVPEFMLSYCKASCGVCSNLGAGNYGNTYIQPNFAPTELNGDSYNQIFGSGLSNNLFSTDLTNGPVDASQLSFPSTLSPAASFYYANLLASNPNYQLTSNDLALLNSLSGADQTGLGTGFGGVNSGLGTGMSPSSQFSPYNSGLYPYKSSTFSAEKKEPKAMAMASNDLGISGGFGLSNSMEKNVNSGQLSTVVRMDELAGA